MRFLPAGSTALLIELDDLSQVLSLLDRLRAGRPEGVAEMIPAARTLALSFDPGLTDPIRLERAVRSLPPAAAQGREAEVHDIPVIYDGEDVAEIADLLGLTVSELVRRHVEATWTVAFTGFAPGFAYMTSNDPVFDLPRRKTPRLRIPAGSVALAGTFGGIYPSDSPGGWQLLGRTPARMWDLSRPRPALLSPGDRVCFHEMAAGRVFPSAAVPPEADSPPAENGMRVLRADRPVLWQDMGRPGLAEQGVGASGALDRAAFQAANACLGNDAGLPALEITLGGFEILCERAATLAVTGAPCPVTVRTRDGRNVVAPFARPFAVDMGERVVLGTPQHGTRSYLAVRGGFSVAEVLGSAARDTLAKLGPDPVAPGDYLLPADFYAGAVDPCPPAPPVLPGAGDVVTLDIIPGPRADWFGLEGMQTLTSQEWLVTPESSRVGMRLSGTLSLHRTDNRELPSEATFAGAIQIPHTGQPVLFLADHPLTGGYPVIACVALHHLDLAGQIPPGARIRFSPQKD